MKHKILIVEDEPSIVTLIQFNLEQAGFATDVAYDGEVAIEKVGEDEFSLIVLDLMLPKLSGLEVCRYLRQNNDHTPILILTAKDDEYDKVYGLEMGADDYLTKPFSPKELIARIHAILRRTDQGQKSVKDKLIIGDLEINPENYEAYLNDKSLQLTRKEFELLVYLAQHKGKILSRDQLLSAVWDYDFVGDTRIVDVHVSHLRDKIEKDTKNPLYIKTIRGFGYKMEDPT